MIIIDENNLEENTNISKTKIICEFVVIVILIC